MKVTIYRMLAAVMMWMDMTPILSLDMMPAMRTGLHHLVMSTFCCWV